MRHVRPARRTSFVFKLSYVLLVLAAGAMVAKCALDLKRQFPDVESEKGVGNQIGATATTAAQGSVVHDADDVQFVESSEPYAMLAGKATDVVPNESVSFRDVLPTDVSPSLESNVPKAIVEQEEIGAEDDGLKTSTPIRQVTPLHQSMLTPGNFLYLGGFRPEFGEGMKSRFGWGGLAVAYRPDGDAASETDGHPGSLFLTGHGHDQLVAEISIPKPFVSPEKNIDDLPVAKTIQPFADPTAGIRTRMTNGSSEPFEIGGMQVVANRLHWTLYKYYNVGGTDYPSHGVSNVNLSTQAMRGLWHLGPMHSGAPQWHSYKHAGYITDIPQSIADHQLGGRNLMSGLQISTGLQKSSQGPALFAYRINNENLPFGESISAIPLLWYPMNDPVAQHHPADSWKGAAWLTLGDKRAVVIVGRKGLGPVHYGMPRPGDCYEDKGYHASAYETQMLFYRPEDLLASAGQAIPAIPPWYRWDSKTPGGGIDRFMYQTCRKQIGGSALDRKRNLLYVVEAHAAKSEVNDYEPLPIIHVFRIVP